MFKERIVGEEAMVAFGYRLGLALSRGGIVYLNGDLGTGKTTVCRGILQALGHRGAVKSPTYTLVEPYVLGGRSVYHFDLYRLADPEELEYIGIRDYFEPHGLCLVEWPERGKAYLPEPDVLMHLSVIGEDRQVICEAGTDYGLEIIKRLKETPGE